GDDWQSLPLLGPVVLVAAVVVVAALGDADLEEIRVAEHRTGGGVAATGVAPDAGAVEVDPGVAFGQLLHAGDLVGQRVVTDVADVGVVEGLGAPGRAHAVDGDRDEAQLGQRLVVAVRGEEAAAAHRARLRAGIDVVDDRIS